jgi:hypothetical protein
MNQKLTKEKGSKDQKSSGQKRYERLLVEIDNRKRLQKTLIENLRLAVHRATAELQPLARAEGDWHIKKLERLDEIVDEIVISKAKKDMFTEYLLSEIKMFLNTSHPMHESLKKLYRKYAKVDFSNGKLDTIESMNRNKEEEENDFFDETEFTDFRDKNETKKKKKPKKKHLKAEEEKKILGTDTKSIYFRLIKKFHPDRQQDIEKQKEYTEITKLITKAYKENDFVGLLKLQIEYLDQSEHHPEDLAEDLIERYNKILSTQLQELDMDISRTKLSSRGLADDFLDENYVFSEDRFKRVKTKLETSIEFIKENIEESHKQKKGWFKQWLKELQETRGLSSNDVLFSDF